MAKVLYKVNITTLAALKLVWSNIYLRYGGQNYSIVGASLIAVAEIQLLPVLDCFSPCATIGIKVENFLIASFH